MSSLFANESKLCWQYIYGLAAILIVPSLPGLLCLAMSGWESFHQVLLTPGYTPGCLKPDHGAERRDTAGKNRPLDEDELHFVEKLLDHERQKDQSVREEEKAALDAFQQVSSCACLTASPFTALCQENGLGLRSGGLTAGMSDVYYPCG